MLTALEDRIILKVEKKTENTTSSGLFLIDNDNTNDNTAKVVSVGPGRKLPNGKQIDPDVKVGDTIVYNRLAVQTINYEDEEFLVIYSKDILAIVGE